MVASPCKGELAEPRSTSARQRHTRVRQFGLLDEVLKEAATQNDSVYFHAIFGSSAQICRWRGLGDSLVTERDH